MPRWGATDRCKGVPLGSWFDRLTTSGWDPVRPELVEGRTGYFQSSRDIVEERNLRFLGRGVYPELRRRAPSK